MQHFEPVFPRPYSNDTSGDFTIGEPAQTGMDLRTYIATQAMQGILADDPGGNYRKYPHHLARTAVEIANALIQELSN